MATWGMNTACGAKAGQIDGPGLHTVEGTHSHDKENDEQYVGWGGSEPSNPTGFGQDWLLISPPHSNSTPKITARQPVSSTRRAQPAFPRWHYQSRHPAFPMKLMSRRLLLPILTQIGCPLVRVHSQDQSGNKCPVKTVAKHPSTSTTNPGINLQAPTSRTSQDRKCYPGGEEGNPSRSHDSRRLSQKG